jgi:hypothetical protein
LIYFTHVTIYENFQREVKDGIIEVFIDWEASVCFAESLVNWIQLARLGFSRLMILFKI